MFSKQLTQFNDGIAAVYHHIPALDFVSGEIVLIKESEILPPDVSDELTQAEADNIYDRIITSGVIEFLSASSPESLESKSIFVRYAEKMRDSRLAQQLEQIGVPKSNSESRNELDFCAYEFDLEELNDLEGLDKLANLGFEEESSEPNLFEELCAISIGQYLSSNPAKSQTCGDQIINANLSSVGSNSTIDEGLKLGIKDTISGSNQGLLKD